MKIALTGGKGFIGNFLKQETEKHGIETVVFTRTPRLPEEKSFSCKNLMDVKDFNAIIHLAGESVLGYWTNQKKRKILESRILGTRMLCESIKRLSVYPSVVIIASAIGYYGDAGDSQIDESSNAGNAFHSEVIKQLEYEANQIEKLGIRVVYLRIGIVLGKDGGILKQMIPIFRNYLGGYYGTGNQWLSFISLDDLTRMILFCLNHDHISGTFNAVMPEAITCRDFVKILAKKMNRPSFINIPDFCIRIIMGESSQFLLNSQRIIPKRFLDLNFEYLFPTVDQYLNQIL